jgi:NAD(P)-dependent dehydrogenase (short-subunit alcohol dehydrogenase family)
VTKEEELQSMFQQIKEQYGRLDAVLNCAGIGIAQRTYNMNKVGMIIRRSSINDRSSVRCMVLLSFNVS